MLLVSDVSLNELECKHALNNSAKTELISRCLRLSRETPDLMLYRWIRCSDLIIYITFLYMKKKENLALIPYSVLIPLRSCGSVRKPGWSSLMRGAPSTPLPPQRAFMERRRGCDSTSFQFAHNPSPDNAPPQCGESTHFPLFQKETVAPQWELRWPFGLSSITHWLVCPQCPLELQSRVTDGCGSECWTGRWHWGSLEWPVDTSIFYGRKDSDWRKIHPENGTAYPLKWGELRGAGFRASATDLGSWDGRDASQLLAGKVGTCSWPGWIFFWIIFLQPMALKDFFPNKKSCIAPSPRDQQYPGRGYFSHSPKSLWR